VDLEFIIILFISYLTGSIPFGLIITKLFLKKDIRNFGSGNIGATNVLRTGNKFLAILTLLLDVSKGFLIILITHNFFNNLIYLAGLLCLLGHIFPIWLNFKGGKGIATYVGILLGISIKVFLVFGLTWLITAAITRYSSLSSILSTFVALCYSYFSYNNSLIFFMITVFIIIVYTHKDNLKRLINKTENKIRFK
tara:strand:+ start:2719 stop:3303 length:585 start_codon:yes stop_codon:yes gene_type:complete